MIWYETQTSGTVPESLHIEIARKPASQIERWSDWPEDVAAVLRPLNHFSCRRLRFTRTTKCGTWPHLGIAGGFDCSRCLVPCMPNKYGDCELDGKFYCDDCMIAMARGGELGG